MVLPSRAHDGAHDYVDFCGTECEPTFGYDFNDRGADLLFGNRWFLACLHKDLERRYLPEDVDPVPDYLCVVGLEDGEQYQIDNPQLTAFMASCWLPCSFEDAELRRALLEEEWIPISCVGG